jgi:hypothetical protein
MRNYRKCYRRDETKNWRNSNSTNIGCTGYIRIVINVIIYKKQNQVSH